MDALNKIIKSRYFYLYLLAALNLLVAYFYVQKPFQNYSDSYIYYDAMTYLRGDETAASPIVFNMILRAPFMLYLTLFFNYFIDSLPWSMMVINIIFYILIIYVFYQMVFEIYKDHKTAALSSVLLFSNYIMFSYGTAFLIDMGGWFFFILSSFFAIKYYNDDSRRKYYFIAAALSLIGVFFKETGALGLITLAMLILLSGFTFKRKVKEIIFAGALVFAPLLIYHIWFYLKFDLTYFYSFIYDLQISASAPAAAGINFLTYAFIHFIKVMAWLYSIGWALFLFGMWQEKRFFDFQRSKILLAMLPASLTFLVWPQLVQRVAFIFVPWLALTSGFGLSKVKNRFLIAGILALYLLTNYLIAHRVA